MDMVIKKKRVRLVKNYSILVLYHTFLYALLGGNMAKEITMLKNLLIAIFCTLLLTGCGGGDSDGGGGETGEILGNPPDVALQMKEYLPGDQLYEEGHPDYYKEGTPYVTAEIEQTLRDLMIHPAWRRS
jgi:hypothetical protein